MTQGHLSKWDRSRCSGPAAPLYPDLHGEQQSRALPLLAVDPPRNLFVLGICWRAEGTFTNCVWKDGSVRVHLPAPIL